MKFTNKFSLLLSWVLLLFAGSAPHALAVGIPGMSKPGVVMERFAHPPERVWEAVLRVVQSETVEGDDQKRGLIEDVGSNIVVYSTLIDTLGVQVYCNVHVAGAQDGTGTLVYFTAFRVDGRSLFYGSRFFKRLQSELENAH